MSDLERLCWSCFGLGASAILVLWGLSEFFR